jgi:hypothetical protein
MYGILLCVLSMGMGFPDIIIEKDLPRVAKRKEVKTTSAPKAASSCTQQAVSKADNRTKTNGTQQKKSPKVNCLSAVATLKDIYLKLFDKKGNLLLIENIKVEEFLSKHYASENLPQGSTFVMFHGNTAYFYIENAG